MRKGQKKKPNAQTIKVHEKERQALELRLAGVRLADIAVQLGYADHSGARLAIDCAMKRLGPLEEAEELRQMEMHRLDDLQFTAAPLLASSKPDETKCAGIDRTLKVMERRAKLCGLDAAEKHQHLPPDEVRVGGFTPEQWAEAESRKILAKKNGGPHRMDDQDVDRGGTRPTGKPTGGENRQ